MASAGCDRGGELELIPPRLVETDRTRTRLPFNVEGGAGYGLRIRCDADEPTHRELDASRLELGTVALFVRRNDLRLVGAGLEVSPARLERIASRAWVGEDGAPVRAQEGYGRLAYLHPDELSQLPAETIADAVRARASGSNRQQELRLVPYLRYAWTFDLILDLRSLDRSFVPVRAEVAPTEPYTGRWEVFLEPHDGDRFRFTFMGADCLVLPGA